MRTVVDTASPTLFLLNMDRDATPDARLSELLTPLELHRSNSFAFPHLGRRFRVRRVALKRLLALATGMEASDVVLEGGAGVKPCMPGGLPFNISHSGPWLLMGIAPEGALGVDIEICRPFSEAEDIATSSFSASEIAALQAAAEADRQTVFFRIWTRKEAFSKALGGGLSIPLDSFSVSGERSPSNALEGCSLDGVDAREWCVRPVSINRYIEAAVAWHRPSFMPRLEKWPTV